MYNHILIPTDGSPLSIVAMEKSIDFARETGGQGHRHNDRGAVSCHFFRRRSDFENARRP
ncbi:protein of unknown function [Methylocella tundrae]|uniref:UspA domain-containing protein n=1 Tax=Methylocella tundrae TaxID=227605 RepID=A0A4U8Z3G7_METTU|nr:protein of unknown function [Methylocella tundrae]